MGRSAGADVLVVGGGVLGASTAYCLARRGVRVTVVDRGVAGSGASSGNFGLVWVQDKAPAPYLTLTLRSAALYPGFARELREVTGIDVELEQPGGLHFCLSDAELAARAAWIAQQARVPGFAGEILDAAALRRLEPHAGPEVVGGSYCPLDGHVNPLALLHALHRGVRRLGGEVRRGWDVRTVQPAAEGSWLVRADRGVLEAGTLVLAAGVGIPALARAVGLEVPVRPQRGQVLVSEPLPPLLRHPSVPLRQGRAGTVFMGGTHEEVGFDARTTAEGVGVIAAAALRYLPVLGRARLVRVWGALRPLTPDGLPIFEQPPEHPGLYLVTAHSGVTLCPAVGQALAEWVAGGRRPEGFPPFERDRFARGAPGGARGGVREAAGAGAAPRALGGRAGEPA